MDKLVFNYLLIIFIPTIVYAQSCDLTQAVNEYGTQVFYEKDKCISFPEVSVKYIGDILENSHEKITSQVFEIKYLHTTKVKKVIFAISIYENVIRFGFKTFLLDVRRGKETLTIKEGDFWALLASLF